MHAALHHGHRHGSRFANYHLPSMANRRRSWERRNVSVRNASRVGKRIGETAETRAENQSDPRPQRGSAKDEFRRNFSGVINIVSHLEGR
jgi:hypothetical protein